MAATTQIIETLADELRTLLGVRGVSTELAARERASVDGSRLSPVISAQLPLGLADIVAYPATAEEIAATVAAAVRHGVAITPRGKGTGNYGQAIPFSGGLVIDASRARTLVSVDDGSITADAGATMISLEQAAAEVGAQILMYPSTVQSTLGGFLAGGSGGTGSIKHGSNSDGFVIALDVVHAVPDARLVHVEGEEAQAYVHNYGTAGIIARATIRTEPLQDWRAFYASFDGFDQAITLIRPFTELDPPPRLVSADPSPLADALPTDAAIPAGRASLRGILDAATLDEATRMVEAAGGRVEAVREGLAQTVKTSMISYNHPIEWLQKAYPNTYFHLEVSGDALVDRIDDVLAVYPGGLLHIESQHARPIGMLAAPYESPDAIWAGFERLTAIGAGYHNPHQWYVDFHPERTLDLAAVTDPSGLLNPGKLVADLTARIDTGRKVS